VTGYWDVLDMLSWGSISPSFPGRIHVGSLGRATGSETPLSVVVVILVVDSSWLLLVSNRADTVSPFAV